MANRLYIYTDQETLVEANYELPLFFYPLLVGNAKIKKNSIYVDSAIGIAFFEQFYNFIQTHADKLITDQSKWQETRRKLSAELARIAEHKWLMLEMSDVFNMSDTPHKAQAEEQLALIGQFNSIIQDAIDADNPYLLDQVTSIQSVYASFSSYPSFKEYFNHENFEYGWSFLEAQFRDDAEQNLLPTTFEEAGKFGLKNTQGKSITPAEYNKIYDFDENTRLCVAEKNGQFCYLNSQGQLAFNQTFDDLFDFLEGSDASKEVAIAKLNNQFGLINSQGQWVVPPNWDDMSSLYARVGLIAVKKGEVWGVIDEVGNIIQTPQYPHKPTPNEEYSTSYYTCSPKDGEPVLCLSLNWKPFQLKKHEIIGELDETNHLRTAIGEGKHARYGLTNKDAENVLECIYSDIEYAYGLHVYRVKQDKKWGLFSPHKGWLLPCEYDQLSIVHSIVDRSLNHITDSAYGQFLVARKSSQYGVFDSLKQTWLLPCTFGKITPYAKNVLGVAHTQPPEEAGLWVHDSTGQRLAGPYQSLSDCGSQFSFTAVAVLAFTHNQVLSVRQTGLVKPLTEAQADELENYLPNDVLGEHYFTQQQATLIKNAFSKAKKTEALENEASALQQQGLYQRAYDLYVLAGQAGNSNGYVNAGYLAESQAELENLPLARHYYELATQAENSMGINNLANCYRYGIGGAQDMKKALQLFHEAEAKNNLLAASNLADIYYHDEQLIDHAQALKYYLKAYREFPYPLQIGYLYDTLLKDYASAHKYYELSAKEGQGYAYNRIGVMWENGELGKINLKKAQSYYQKAMSAEYSNGDAGLNLAKLISQTDPKAAKVAWQFAMGHEDEVEGLLEYGQQQGWA